MGLWTNFVDLVHAVLLGLAMLFGGNMALAIGVLSLSFRLALLPLTLRKPPRKRRSVMALSASIHPVRPSS